MKAVVCTYGSTYERLAQVLKKSIQRNSPGVRVAIHSMRPIRTAQVIPDHVRFNTAKLELWNRVVQAAEEDIICMDADMLCLGNLAEAFEEEFDLAYTVRPGLKHYQGGIVFVRPTEAGKAVMQEWTLLNDNLLDDIDRLTELIQQEGGANQAALSLLVKEGLNGAVLRELPCELWNCCAQTWGTFGPETRVLHMTGRLRRAVMEGRMPDPGGPYADLAPMVKAWLEYAR